MISHLRTVHMYKNRHWLSPADDLRLRMICRQLIEEDTIMQNCMKPILLSTLQHLEKHIKPSNEVLFLAMRLGHDALLRAGELLKLDKSCLEFDKNELTLTLVKSKANKSTRPEIIKLYDTGKHSTVRLLKKWKKHCPSNRLFGFTPTEFNNAIRKLMKKITIHYRRYSGHSLRAGGATDLFNAKIPYPIIKLFGRWKSDAALRYFRDEKYENKIANKFRWKKRSVK